MTDSSHKDLAYDHLIIGSTALAGLVAGLLRREHGKRVCLVAEPYSPFGLERRFDVSMDLVTRPETLKLLSRLSGETIKLINSLGKNLVQPASPLFIAETRASADALGHFMYLIRALDLPFDRVVDRNISAGSMVRVNGQSLIAHHRFAPALEAWLDSAEVRRLDPDDTGITIRKDGTARITAEGREVEAANVVLADDAAVLAHLSEDAWDRAVIRATSTAMLLQPAKLAPNPLAVWIDRGVVLRQEPKASLGAIVSGARDTAEARLASAAGKSLPLRRAGEARFESLATSDGAPIMALAPRIKVTHLVGFGLAGAFYAPAVARQLAGRATEEEVAWFAARGATRGNLRLNAAEFAAVPA